MRFDFTMRGRNIFWLAVTLLLGFFGLSRLVKRQRSGLKPVPELDLDRYQGKWYQIAFLPNWLERQCKTNTHRTTEYWLNNDGTVNVIIECTRKNGRTKIAEGLAKVDPKYMKNSVLKVRFANNPLSFLPFGWGDYWVIDLDTDYQYSVVSEPGRKYLWILGREPRMDEVTYTLLLDKIAAQGYDIDRIVRNN
jgi:apolipoprotein D and lipocalin family protein